jgi:hypothetical protein
MRAPAQPARRGRGKVALEARPVERHARRERDVGEIGLVEQSDASTAAKSATSTRRLSSPSPARNPVVSSSVVARGAQRDRQRAAADADLERALDRDRVVDRLDANGRSHA